MRFPATEVSPQHTATAVLHCGDAPLGRSQSPFSKLCAQSSSFIWSDPRTLQSVESGQHTSVWHAEVDYFPVCILSVHPCAIPDSAESSTSVSSVVLGSLDSLVLKSLLRSAWSVLGDRLWISWWCFPLQSFTHGKAEITLYVCLCEH